MVGLGNPGERYARTRHNAGFMVAERFRTRHALPRPRSRYAGRYSEGSAAGRRAAVLLPMTFMNASGDAVVQAVTSRKIPLKNIIVVHDDLDFPFGTVRVRRGGGSGGHNGLKSIAHRLGAPDFSRVRVGIGRPDDPRFDISDYVLSRFKASETELERVIDAAANCVEEILTGGIEAAMTKCNKIDPGFQMLDSG